jgi:LysM repeat protein
LPTPTPLAGRFYTVESGDTIITIALANGVDWQELLKLNGLQEDSFLQIGQKIRLPEE